MGGIIKLAIERPVAVLALILMAIGRAGRLFRSGLRLTMGSL